MSMKHLPSTMSLATHTHHGLDLAWTWPWRWNGECFAEFRSRPFRDSAFTHQDWDYQSTWKRYLPEPRVLVTVLTSLAPLILWSVLVSGLLGLYATYAEVRQRQLLFFSPSRGILAVVARSKVALVWNFELLKALP
jgi:hypothetical protein